MNYDHLIYLFFLISDIRMLRRNPTRIELKLIDIEKEYEVMKKDRESQQNKMLASIASTSDTPTSLKTKTDIIHERIGYDPKPKMQSSKSHIVN